MKAGTIIFFAVVTVIASVVLFLEAPTSTVSSASAPMGAPFVQVAERYYVLETAHMSCLVHHTDWLESTRIDCVPIDK